MWHYFGCVRPGCLCHPLQVVLQGCTLYCRRLQWGTCGRVELDPRRLHRSLQLRYPGELSQWCVAVGCCQLHAALEHGVHEAA